MEEIKPETLDVLLALADEKDAEKRYYECRVKLAEDIPRNHGNGNMKIGYIQQALFNDRIVFAGYAHCCAATVKAVDLEEPDKVLIHEATNVRDMIPVQMKKGKEGRDYFLVNGGGCNSYGLELFEVGKGRRGRLELRLVDAALRRHYGPDCMQVNPKWRLAPEHGGVFVYDDAHRLYVMNNDVRACQDITGVVDGMGVKMDESREMLNRFRRYIVRHQGLVHAFEGDKPEDGVVFTPRDGGGYSVAPLGYFLEQRKKPAE